MKKILHIIGNAHLDPVWLWPYRDGWSETLATAQSAVDRMVENPDFCFSCSSAMFYRWVERSDPRLFAGIRKRIKEGRWEPIGGWVVQPDCNTPSTESFIRQCLYGKRDFAEKTGRDVAIGYSVDSSGHGLGLPQIFRQSGYREYVLMRPFPAECEMPLLFWWEGPDGSRILCWRIPGGYSQSPYDTPEDLEQYLRVAVQNNFPPGIDHGVFFLGVGNHGGGPTRRQIEKIVRLRQDGFPVELKFDTLGNFFAAARKSPGFNRIPVVRKELLHTQVGCYSALGEIKALNRRAERSLATAETLALAEKIILGRDYPKRKIEKAWSTLLFNHFHDIITGCSIKSSYTNARDQLGAVCDTADRIRISAVHALARAVDTSTAKGGVVFLLNTLPWSRPAPVSFDMSPFPDKQVRYTHLETDQGEKVPLQWSNADSSIGPWGIEWRKLNAVVVLPACGYRVLQFAGGRPPKAKPWLEQIPIECDTGAAGIASLKAPDGTQLLFRSAGFTIIEDGSDTWGHGVYEFRKEIGRPVFGSGKVIDDGPVFRRVRQKAVWGSSEIILDILTYRDIPAIELRCLVNWQEKHRILKLEIPTVLQDVRTFANVPGAVAERRPLGNEEPGQDWVALEGRINGRVYSLGVVRDAPHSYDCLGGLFRTIIVRSAFFAQHDPVKPGPDFDNPYLDQGWQEKRIWLVCAAGDHRKLKLNRCSEEMQSPVEYVMDSVHPGFLPQEKSGLSVAPDTIAVTAVKESEDGKGVVIRIQEMSGRKTPARIQIPDLGVEHSVQLRPWEIKTLKILGQEKVLETDLLERKT